MQFIYNNYEVMSEKHYIKNYGSFKEIYVLKSVKNSGFEPIISKKSSTYEKNRVSTSRIKSKIRDFSLCNDFEYFYTQTINQNYNRFDLEEIKSLLLNKFKAYKRINKDFIYLIIFEKHKNGAFHVHGLLGKIGVDLHKNSNGYDTLEFFSNLGFNSLSLIKDKLKISSYITKYITKDFQKTASGFSYFHSKGLKLPIVKETYIDNFSSFNLKYENKFLKIFEV